MVSNSIVQTTLNRILNEIVESNHRQNAEIENPRKNIFHQITKITYYKTSTMSSTAIRISLIIQPTQN